MTIFICLLRSWTGKTPEREGTNMAQRNQTALITGASSGIGLDFAHKFAEEGYHVVLVARSRGKLEQLAAELTQKHGITAHVLPADLTDPHAPQALVEQLASQGITVDVLVNNAGFAGYGLFHELDTREQIDMIQVNITALTHLTRLLLPGMVARKAGKVLNVASTASFQPGPLMAVYYATKAYVLHFSEAINNELEGTGVSVTALCPGPTTSGFQARAAMQEARIVQGGLMDSRTVVEAGYAGLMAGKPLVIPGFRNRALAFATRFVPRTQVTRMARSIQERVSH
jgi:uncharacterized protein